MNSLPPLIITTLAPEIESGNSDSEHVLNPPTTPPSNRLALSPNSPQHSAIHSPSPTSPASPTLSASSVRFNNISPPTTPEKPHLTSLALRNNHPTAHDGSRTLDVLDDDERTHARRSSNATWISDVTAADSSAVHTSSPTKTALDKIELKKKTGKVEEAVEQEERQFRLDLEQEEQGEINIGHFTIKPKKLASLVDPKSILLLRSLGGTAGILEALGTDPTKGLDEQVLAGFGAGSGVVDTSIEERKRVYGSNTLPFKQSKTLLSLIWLALKDKVLIILMIAAVVSLALGLYTDLGRPAETIEDGSGHFVAVPKVDWVEGVAILIAVAVVSLVGATNDWQKEKQFKKLNAQKEDRGIKVIRSGKEQIISVYEVVVGDIAILEPGEIIPVDGIFLRGHSVKCDESGATGESDAINKATYEECLAEREGKEETGKGFKNDCFMVSGGKILEGVGEYVVIAVGPNSFNGRTLMALRGDSPATPLQLKLNALAELIAKLGSLAGLILFGSLMIRFFVQLGTNNPHRSPSDNGNAFIDILIIAVTIVVVAVPEGLPLAVTLALAFATKRMTKENLLVRLLGACETMGNATVVCTDKTGTLTQNVMSVVAGSIGVKAKFVQRLEENKARTNADEARQDFSLDMKTLNDILNPAVQELFNEAIVLNSTAFEDKDPDSGELVFVGSKTETALLRFAKDLGWKDYKLTRKSCKIVQMLPFSSERKSMGVVIELPNGTHRVYFKGASEILLRLCTQYLEISREIVSDKVELSYFNEETRSNIENTIILYANNMLRTIAICYRDVDVWPPTDMDENGSAPFSWLARDLVLLAVTGIEDPLRAGVTESVVTCAEAGVAVKMCTGDNVLTARSIATQCGIYTPGGIIMEGPVFRNLSKPELHAIVPRLQVLARSSPEDKKILVATLQELGEVVGVTGDGTNDGPALKQADVGFSMGIAGTEVAKEASDIILMDDNFSSIVSAICWGRCVNDSVAKFLQFQISVNITAVVITFVSAVASAQETSVLTAVQLLWVNLIMDTFAALALATDPASPQSLKRKPTAKTAPLITVDMLKMIIGQALFQIIACLILHFLGGRILKHICFDALTCSRQQREVSTIVFNAFVFCQIFNQLNCRRLDRGLNVFVEFFRNYYFLAIFGIMIGGQIIIVFFGGSAFQVTRINGRDWGISIVVGALSLPLGVIIRLLPTAPFARLLYKLRIYRDPEALPEINPDAQTYEWNEAITRTIDNLSTYRTIRGGRLRSSSMAFKSRTAMLEQKDIRPMSLLAMVPTLIASSVGAGWHPSSNDIGNPSQNPSASSTALWQGKVQIHPDTDRSDPFWQRFGPH